MWSALRLAFWLGIFIPIYIAGYAVWEIRCAISYLVQRVRALFR